MKKQSRLMAALLLCAVLLSLCSGAALAEDAPSDEPPIGFWYVRVYVDGLLSGRALGSYEGAWLAVEDLCSLLGVETQTWWNPETGELTISGSGFVLHAVAGQEYFSVNSRYLYEPGGFFLFDGRSWFPSATISRIFGAATVLSDDGQRVDLNGAELAIMQGGAAWYADHFDNAELFWLARIIHSEAKNQPLAGRIGVGNVVLNRVHSERYPNNVKDVIFDEQFAVQFTPASSGSVYAEPDELDVISACLCLEGYNTVGESMFFVNPDVASDAWFRKTKDYVITIGDHDFYKLKG